MIEVSRKRGTLNGIIAIVNENVLGLAFHASLEFKLLIKVLEPRPLNLHNLSSTT